jgi:hypothetical protein
LHPHALVHVGRTWMVGAEGPTTTDGAIQLVTVPVVVEAVMAHRVASTRTARALPAIRRRQVWLELPTMAMEPTVETQWICSNYATVLRPYPLPPHIALPGARPDRFEPGRLTPRG